jgi:hypothetical protein
MKEPLISTSGISYGLTAYDAVVASGEINLIRINDSTVIEETTLFENGVKYIFSNTARRIVTDVIISNPDTQCRFKAKALWDTGATESGIGKECADKLMLKTIPGKERKVLTLDGYADRNLYCADLEIPNICKFNQHEFVGHETMLPQKIDIVIGMDIISKGKISIYTRDDKTVFEFEMK